MAIGSLLGLLATGYYLSQGPDIPLSFRREVPSAFEPDRVDRNLSALSRWPAWFHSLKRASLLKESPTGGFGMGSHLLLEIDPKKAMKKGFNLEFEVSEYVPGRKLGLKLIQDSSHRLTDIFEPLEWTIEILPPPVGLKPGKREVKSVLVGSVQTQTRNWRGRLFGKLAEKILLNQTFYPDMVKLAELRQPFTAEIPASSLGIMGPDQ